jgi:DNA-directed RNA polymerase specialized sigma24 family protein
MSVRSIRARSAVARGTGAPASDRAGSRTRIASALERCTERERLVLALLLYERLTPPEAADALGVTAGQVRRMYDALLRDLRGAIRSATLRRSRRPRETRETLKRAS